jgi:hypothetical protein
MDRRRVDTHECQPFEPVGGARSQGASDGENNRCGSKSLIWTHLVVSDWRCEKLRLLPGPPRTLVLTEISRGLPNTRDLARAFRLAFSLHQEKGPLSGNLGPCVSGLEKTFPGARA